MKDLKTIIKTTQYNFNPESATKQMMFQCALFLACQYHRALENQNARFLELAESYIEIFERKIGKYMTYEEEQLEDMADELDKYVLQMSGGDEYKFKILISVANNYFKTHKHILIQNSMIIKNRKMIEANWSTARRKKWFKQNWEILPRPFNSFHAMLSKLSIKIKDVENCVSYLDSLFQIEYENA